MMTDISHRTTVVNLLDAAAGLKAKAKANPASAPVGDEAAQPAPAASPKAALAVVDIFGHESCMFALMGAGVGAATFSVKHGDDPDNLTDADPMCLVMDEEVEAASTVIRLGYIGARRYVQVEPSVTPTAAVAVLQRPDVCPKTKAKDDDATARAKTARK